MLKGKIVRWLKTKTKEDIIFTKKNPEFSIFMKHPGMTMHEAHMLVEEPDKVTQVELSKSHEDRLEIIRLFSKKYNTEYIILDPFHPNIESKFKNKVAIVTMYPINNMK